jgi:uncharacterized RDD family membrane protein YckC
MDSSQSALVLTGEVLPGHDAEAVWPALAAYFRMEFGMFESQVLARVPMTIKESDDLDKLRLLRDGAHAVGAEAVIVPLDATSLFVLPGDTPRGPLPLAFVEERVRAGEWPSSLRVAAVGDDAWITWAEFGTSAAAAAPAVAANPPTTRAKPWTPDATDLASTYIMPRVDAAAMAAARAATPANAPPESATSDAALLPAGDAIHAGFWRRSAALMLDMLVLAIPLLAIRYAFFLANSELLGTIVVIVGLWLYFALLESTDMQATIGKRVMDLKVTDDHGARIGFGRATGRHFGKIVSGLILYIGYMLAGWTARKQALHDMMASCCVVFRNVEPGQPLPTVRAPMPWYGWALNALPFLAVLGAILGGVSLVRALGGLG